MNTSEPEEEGCCKWSMVAVNKQHVTGTKLPTGTVVFLLNALYSHFICLKLWTMEKIFVHI